MTIQEANALVGDFSFVYKGKSISKEVLIECREVIHKALEKQIHKKLIIDNKGFHDVDYKDYLCPYCKKRIITKIDGDFIAGRKSYYCDNCGQALDWSEGRNETIKR